MARNEESGTGEARIKREECGEFVSFLSPFSYSCTHLPTPSALLFLHRTPCTHPLARIRPAAMAQDANNAVFPTDGAIFFLFFSFFPFFKKKLQLGFSCCEIPSRGASTKIPGLSPVGRWSRERRGSFTTREPWPYAGSGSESTMAETAPSREERVPSTVGGGGTEIPLGGVPEGTWREHARGGGQVNAPRSEWGVTGPRQSRPRPRWRKPSRAEAESPGPRQAMASNRPLHWEPLGPTT